MDFVAEISDVRPWTKSEMKKKTLGQTAKIVSFVFFKFWLLPWSVFVGHRTDKINNREMMKAKKKVATRWVPKKKVVFDS